MSELKFEGQVALVTGASRGIGAAIALELARKGLKVIGTATTEAGATKIREALAAFHTLCRIEGIIPALESSHALAYAAKLAPSMSKDKILLVNLSGRGDKDMHTVAEKSGIVF